MIGAPKNRQSLPNRREEDGRLPLSNWSFTREFLGHRTSDIQRSGDRRLQVPVRRAPTSCVPDTSDTAGVRWLGVSGRWDRPRASGCFPVQGGSMQHSQSPIIAEARSMMTTTIKLMSGSVQTEAAGSGTDFQAPKGLAKSAATRNSIAEIDRASVIRWVAASNCSLIAR